MLSTDQCDCTYSTRVMKNPTMSMSLRPTQFCSAYGLLFFNFLSTTRACWLVIKLFKIETVLIADAPDLFMLIRHTSGSQSTEIPNHLYDLSWPVPGCGLFHFYPYLPPEGRANPKGSRIAVSRGNPRGCLLL